MARKWEASKYELNFEKYLTNGGYTFNVKSECMNNTRYLITKDGVTMEHVFPHMPLKNIRKYYDTFEQTFNMYKQIKNSKD